MAFIRTKRVGNSEYYQLVESRRIDGKPRQKVIVHLGRHPTIDEALKEWPKEISSLRERAAKEREAAKIWPENSRIYREIVKRVESEEKRADDLEANLKKLHKLRTNRVV